jgi:TRAP-type C4-dicarboxylate transport system permease small subunit
MLREQTPGGNPLAMPCPRCGCPGNYVPHGRYLRHVVFFLDDPAWSEEIVLTLMSYMAVLSAALSIRTNAHIRMTALDSYLPKKLIMVLDVVSDLAVMALGIIMLVVGYNYATTLGSRGFYVSIPTLSKFWQYLPIPVAGFAMIVFELEALIGNLKKFFVKEEA